MTSALVGCEWLASRPCRFNPGDRALVTHWIGCWTDPRAGLDDTQKLTFLTLPRFELRPFGCPSRSQSLYRLRYRGSLLFLMRDNVSFLYTSTGPQDRPKRETVNCHFVQYTYIHFLLWEAKVTNALNLNTEVSIYPGSLKWEPRLQSASFKGKLQLHCLFACSFPKGPFMNIPCSRAVKTAFNGNHSSHFYVKNAQAVTEL
jgi:hypothetical protein